MEQTTKFLIFYTFTGQNIYETWLLYKLDLSNEKLNEERGKESTGIRQ
jgi:hypothetical protein